MLFDTNRDAKKKVIKSLLAGAGVMADMPDSNPGFRLRGQSDIRLHYTSLLDAEAHSSRRLQSIRAGEHTSRIDVVCALFFASIRSHNDHMSRLDLLISEHCLAFSEEVVILSRMERAQFVKPTCHAVWVNC